MPAHRLPTSSLSTILALCLAAGLLSACHTAPRSADRPRTPTVLADPLPPPNTFAVGRTTAIWIKYPPASPVIAIAAIAIESPDQTPRFHEQIQAAADAVDADFILVEQTQDFLNPLAPSQAFTELWPAATIAPGGVMPPTRVTALLLKRSAQQAAFQSGYFDPAAQTNTAAQRESLFRWKPGQRYNHEGRFVASPFAPERPPINVTDLPEGTEVICPYTHRIFVLR